MKIFLIGLLSVLGIAAFGAGEPIQRNALDTNAHPTSASNTGFVRVTETNATSLSRLSTPGAPFTKWTFFFAFGASNTEGVYTNNGGGVFGIFTNRTYVTQLREVYLTNNPNVGSIGTVNAVGGYTFDDNLFNLTNVIIPFWQPQVSATTNIIVSFYSGDNNLGRGDTAAYIITQATNAITRAHAAGFEFVLWTIPSSRLTTNRLFFTQQQLAYNDWCRTNGVFLADYLMDVDKLLPGPDPLYTADGGLAHHSPGVMQVIASHLNMVLRSPKHTVLFPPSAMVSGKTFQPTPGGSIRYPAPVAGGTNPPAEIDVINTNGIRHFDGSVFVNTNGQAFLKSTNANALATDGDGMVVVATNSYFARQATDSALGSSTVFTNSSIAVTIPAGEWVVVAYAAFDSNAGGSKAQITASVNVDYRGTVTYGLNAASPVTVFGWPTTGSVNIKAASSGTDSVGYQWLVQVTTSQATTLTLQWAQNSSSVNNTILKAGSAMTVHRSQ